jgi:hypothetical protein
MVIRYNLLGKEYILDLASIATRLLMLDTRYWMLDENRACSIENPGGGIGA